MHPVSLRCSAHRCGTFADRVAPHFDMADIVGTADGRGGRPLFVCQGESRDARDSDANWRVLAGS
jgi:hypothetical protein